MEALGGGETEPRDSGETEPRDSGDSGVGSPSPSGAVRAWGRKAAWRKEARMLAGARAAAQRLAAEHGGEVLLLYRPRSHPNLPSLEPCQVSTRPSEHAKDISFDNDYNYLNQFCTILLSWLMEIRIP